VSEPQDISPFKTLAPLTNNFDFLSYQTNILVNPIIDTYTLNGLFEDTCIKIGQSRLSSDNETRMTTANINKYFTHGTIGSLSIITTTDQGTVTTRPSFYSGKFILNERLAPLTQRWRYQNTGVMSDLYNKVSDQLDSNLVSVQRYAKDPLNLLATAFGLNYSTEKTLTATPLLIKLMLEASKYRSGELMFEQSALPANAAWNANAGITCSLHRWSVYFFQCRGCSTSIWLCSTTI